VAREKHLVLSIVWCEDGRRSVRRVLQGYGILHHGIGTSKGPLDHSTLVRPRFDSCRAVVCGEIGDLERHYISFDLLWLWLIRSEL